MRNCEPARAIHLALDQQRMGPVEKLRVMLEVLGRGLHRMHHVRG